MGVMTRSLISVLAIAVLGFGAFAQVRTPSAAPKITTATCGRPICTWNAFGPVTYTRQTGQPQTITNSFSLLNPNTQFTMHVDNSGVSSAVIMLNGVQVLGPSDFSGNATSLDRRVTLGPNNTLEVQLRGKPGTSLSLTVVGVDNDPPSIAEAETPSANSFGWNNTNVNVTFACSDPTSGIASCPGSVLLTTEGLNQLVAGTTFDLAANSATASVQVSIDETPPTILPIHNPPVNSFGWNNSPVTVSFLCNDNLSGVQICTPPVLLSNEGQNQTLIGMAADFAGNSATASTVVSIDLTPPTITATAAPLPNANGWNNSPVTVTFSCADALSGTASCPPNQTISSEGANQGISGIASDKAGNIASASVDLNIDKTPPVISISSPATGTTVTSTRLQLTGTVSDNLSGVALVTCDGMAAVISSGTFSCNLSLRAGNNAIQVQATDQAGNVASSQITVTFNATPPPPPNSILITPSLANLLVGNTRIVALIGDVGQPVTGATWSISDPTIVSISITDPPQLIALAQGTATLTATFNALTATMTINVLPGTLPAGTPIWSADPLPGESAFQILPASPINPGDPDIYVLERPSTLRAFTADGRQLWAAPITATPQPTSSEVTPNLTATATQAPISRPSSLSPTLALAPVQRVDPLHTAIEKRMQLANQSQSTTLQTAKPTSVSTSAEQAAVAAVTTSRTFLGRSVPDSRGGTINWITTLPSPGANPQDSLVRLDSQGAQTWRFDAPGFLNENFAVSGDGTIYTTDLIQTGKGTDIFLFSPQNTQSNLLAFDTTTGQQKFSIPLPSGHLFWQFIDQIGQPPRIAVDLDIGAIVGPVSVLPDGSAQIVMETIQTSQTNTTPFASGQFVPGICPSRAQCETSASVHKAVELIQVQPDGTFTSQPMTNFALDNKNCFGNCGGPNAGADWAGVFPDFEPGEIIPDGQGGMLAEWFDESFKTDGTTAVSGTNLVHFFLSGGNSQFTLPLRPGGNFGDPATTLVLGDMGAAFANDGLNVTAVDSSSGATKWSFNPGTNIFTILAATADGGLILFGRGGEIVALDASGNVTADTTSLNLSILTYSDSNTVLDITTGGQIQMASLSNPGLAGVAWPLPDGNQQEERTPAKPTITEITPARALITDTVTVTIKGSFGANPSVNFDSGITSTITKSDQNQITASFAIDGKAKPGKHSFTVMDSRGPSDPKNFFVQIPASLEVKKVTVLPDGPEPPSGCPGSLPYGIRVDVTYQLLDQDEKPQPIRSAIMIPHEQGTLFKGTPFDNDIGPVDGFPTSGKTTSADGTFHDVPVGVCSQFPISLPGLTATQNITMILPNQPYPVRSQTITVSAPGVQSFEHGTLKNRLQQPSSGSDIEAQR